jgi:hypothetical protein
VLEPRGLVGPFNDRYKYVIDHIINNARKGNGLFFGLV